MANLILNTTIAGDQSPALTLNGPTTQGLTVFGDIIPPDANVNFKITGGVNVPANGDPTTLGRFDSYNFDSSFGILGTYFGTNIRAAFGDPSLAPTLPASALHGSVSGSGQTVNFGVGIDNTLPERTNTFGTPEFFRNIGNQLTVIPPALELSTANMINNLPGLTTLRDYGYASAGYPDPLQSYLIQNQPGYALALGYSSDHSPVYHIGPTYSPQIPIGNGTPAINPISVTTAYQYAAPTTQVLSNGNNYLPGGQPVGSIFGQRVNTLNYRDSFVGDGSGKLSSAHYYISPTSYTDIAQFRI